MFYSQRLSIIAWMKEWGCGWLASFFSYGLLWSAHAPRDNPEAAFVFLLPVLIWFHFRPSIRRVIICLLVTGWIYQIAMVGWMRHVSFGGMTIATFLLSLYHLGWFLVARVWYARFNIGEFKLRLLVIAGLSALWVSVEWTRTLFTLGFPWCPLSATQWERPVLLQTSFFASAWTVSFFWYSSIYVLVHTFIIFDQEAYCIRFFKPFDMLRVVSWPFTDVSFGLSFLFKALQDRRKKLKVGVCQPYLLDKWKEGRALLHKKILSQQTEFLALLDPDIILWPEASTPYPINLDPLWVEKLAAETGVPILAGSVVREEELSYNAMVYVDPVKGMNPEWYAKQILVPFGEYVPFPFSPHSWSR